MTDDDLFCSEADVPKRHAPEFEVFEEVLDLKYRPLAEAATDPFEFDV